MSKKIPVSEQMVYRQADPVATDLASLLVSLRDELGNALGDNLERAILYGSYARDDARPDSDVDVLIVLRQADEVVQETVHRIAYRLMWECDFRYLLALNIMDIGHYRLLRDHQSSYLRHVECEGRPL